MVLIQATATSPVCPLPLRAKRSLLPGLSQPIPSNTNSLDILLTVSWANAVDDAAINNAAKSLFSQAETAAEAMGVYNEYLYLNYAANFQDPIAGYGAASKVKLQTMSKKYDRIRSSRIRFPVGLSCSRGLESCR